MVGWFVGAETKPATAKTSKMLNEFWLKSVHGREQRVAVMPGQKTPQTIEIYGENECLSDVPNRSQWRKLQIAQGETVNEALLSLRYKNFRISGLKKFGTAKNSSTDKIQFKDFLPWQ